MIIDIMGIERIIKMNVKKITDNLGKIFSIVIVGVICTLYVVVLFRIEISDGIFIAANTFVLGVTGSAVVSLIFKWKQLPRILGIILVVLLSALGIYSGYNLNSSIRERKELVEINKLLRVVGKAVLDDYFQTLNRKPVFLKETERQEKLKKIQKLIEDAEQAGELVEASAWYLGIIAFHRNERKVAIERLSKFIEDIGSAAANGKLSKAHYARGLIRYGLALDLVGVERCNNLIQVYKDAKAAVKADAEKKYKQLLYKVSKDIISEGNCKTAVEKNRGVDINEVQKFASYALGPTSLPQPEMSTYVNKNKWELIEHQKDKAIAIYKLDLGYIRLVPDLKSVLVEISSPTWQIVSAAPDMSFESIMEIQQEPEVRKTEQRLWSLLFPNFDPELNWSIVVKVKKWGSVPDKPEFSTKVDYLRYP